MGSREDNDFLKRVSVASPCSASWDAMTGDDKVRLCGLCERNIYNISSMSAAEAAALIQNATERTCIRMFRRADGTLMTNDCPTGLRAYRQRVGRTVSAAFAMVLGLFSISNAQRIPHGDSKGTRSESNIEIPSIDGTVIDSNGAVIPDATVTVTTPSGKKLVAKTNQKGFFRLIHFRMLGGKNHLRIESPGFNSFSDVFTIRQRESITFPAQLSVGTWIGVVTVTEAQMIDPRKTSISTRIILNDN